MVKSKKLKAIKIVLFVILGLITAILITFIPTFNLETRGMNRLKGEYVTVFYEREAAAARAVFDLAEAESGRIAHSLDFSSPQHINIFIYDHQRTMQARQYGWLVLLLNVDWFVGHNRGTNVLLTSPANPGSVHDWDSMLQVAIHEIVHAYNYILNNNMPLWINEGIATYLSNQNPRELGFIIPMEAFYQGAIPTPEDTRTSNRIRFSGMAGYQFSFTFIEYLHETFCWDSVLTLARTNSFEEAFGKDENAIFEGWVEFVKDNYSR